jgi:60 kDa SS-A/Ro ribonucleoprotein
MVDYACKKLRDPDEIAKARCFPYQLLATYLNTGATPEGFGWTTRYWQTYSRYDDGKGKAADAITIPKEVRNALESAMEVAIQNVPAIPGQVFICPDTSGSMGYPVTGLRDYGYGKSPSTKVRCVDVAGLVTAAVLRRNPMARALPFSTKVHDIELHPMDSILRNAAKFSALGGGGTACSEPLRVLNALNAEGDVVIFVSDYESWSDPSGNRGTAMMQEWNRFKVRNPKAKLVCIDVTPRRNHQAKQNPDVLCVGGFSDQVFKIMDQFVTGKLHPDHWVGLIESVEL